MPPSYCSQRASFSELLLLLLCDEMSSNIGFGGVVVFLDTVFAKSVWGLTLFGRIRNGAFRGGENDGDKTYPLVICLFLKAASFWVAGDMIVSDGETYLSEDLLVQTQCQNTRLDVIR